MSYPTKIPASDTKHVVKSWGYEDWYHNGEYCAKLLYFRPNQQCSLHYHVVKDEVLIVKRGSGWIICGPIGRAGQPSDLGDADHFHLPVHAGDTVHMPRQTLHRIVASGLGLEIFEASTHHEDADSVRIVK